MNWQSRLAVAVMAALSMSIVHAAELTEEQRAVHVLNRLGYGPRPGELEKVVAMGVDHYIDLQLNPEKIRLPNELLDRLDTLTSQDMPAGDLLAEFRAANKAVKDGDEDAKNKRKETFKLITEQTAEARLARAINSPAQLEEVMVDFWFNHFNVYENKGFDRALVPSYERDAIRPYVLGHFGDMLKATAKHPAMLYYLDNWQSVAPGFKPLSPNQKADGLNENYAREVMELHTLGVDGGYTQKDVTELARMLTGWTFEPNKMENGGATFHFAPRRHDDGDKDWLGKHIGPRGEKEGEWALEVLAMHPATARHISYQLAQYFVNDDPSPVLVDKLTKRYLETQGDIREVLRTLFASKEFWDPAQLDSKFKTPYQYVVSAARATGMNIANIRPLLNVLRQLGMPLYGCPTPDGYKNTEVAWLNPDAMTRRITFATALASGKLPVTHNPDDDTGMPAVKGKDDKPVQTGPVDAQMLLTTLGTAISQNTRDTINANPPQLRAAMVLGSPDFMHH